MVAFSCLSQWAFPIRPLSLWLLQKPSLKLRKQAIVYKDVCSFPWRAPMGWNWHHGSMLTLQEMVEHLLCSIPSLSPETADWDGFWVMLAPTGYPCWQHPNVPHLPSTNSQWSDMPCYRRSAGQVVSLIFLSVWPQKGALTSPIFGFAFLQEIHQNPLPMSQGHFEG